ncbi:hypothetical protein DLJ53_30360 [Acuticoccus sediminis]|uniref:HTH luxR-type domain-containing protein n=1 Tax=Acuticoccus sediminis TaxID=2184697 RepID=A0A8B2NIP2_9HYPH|nr:hypothetical protein [Acuticoccus sediminis]RAH96982.1 hypothetical protein DLJ53_30360 [Acuticoccus sediminis]
MNTPALALDFVERQSIERTEFFTDWKRPQGFGVGGIAVNVARSSRHILCASVELSDRQEELYAGSLSLLLERLVPHLKTLAELNGQSWSRGIHATVDTMQTGVLVLSHLGQVLHMNSAADRLLSATSLSIDAKGTLRGRTPEAEGIVDAAIGEVVAGRVAARTVRLRDLGYLGDISLTVSGIPEVAGRPPLWSLSPLSSPAAVVYLAADHERARTIVPRVMAAYGLSEDEAFMAFFIYCGTKLDQIAKVTGQSAYDAQVTIDRVMKKMDAPRYADVVRRVARFAAAV